MQYVKSLVLSVSLLMSATVCNAAPTIDPPDCFPPEECVPIDGGLVLALGAGSVLAYKALRKKEEHSE